MGDCMRLKAEWERQRAILLAFPHQHSDWDHYLIEAQICFINIIKTITQFQDVIICMHPDDKQGLALLEQAFCDAPPSLARFSRFSQISLRGLQAMESLQLNDRILLVGIETNDTWARDFGAISLEDAHGSDNGNNSKTSEIVLLDFIFNGWGNKFDSTQDNQITQKLHNLNILKGKLISLPFVLEGGSIDTNGKGVLLTIRNASLSHIAIRNSHKIQFKNFSYKILAYHKCYGLIMGFWKAMIQIAISIHWRALSVKIR